MLPCPVRFASLQPNRSLPTLHRQLHTPHSLYFLIAHHSPLAPSPLLNSFPCHTSEKGAEIPFLAARKSFRCHTYKNTLPQVLWLPHIQKTGGCPNRVWEPRFTSETCQRLDYPLPTTHHPLSALECLPYESCQLY